jgi:UDP-3-O-[3-hydroxymyristoyl] glucosamine N-acyltransferase
MITAKDIAEKYNGKIIGDETARVKCFCSIKDSKEGGLAYVIDLKYYSYLPDTKSAIVIAPIDDALPKTNATVIMVNSPTYVFTMILRMWDAETRKIEKGISSTATISNTAKIGENVYISENVFVGDNAEIGDNTQILANTYIGKNTKIGTNCLIYPNVSIMNDIFVGNNVIIHAGVVIGSDGFGFLFDKGVHLKIPQIGTVEIQDNVEIGGNTTIDRATIGKTIIGEGTKIDNLVQIAHNVEIGKKCIICAQVGIAGSTIIGDFVTLAGQAGVTGHITIGSGATIAGQAGVTKNVKPKEIVSGFPAMLHKEANHLEVLKRKLPEMYETIKYLQKELKARGHVPLANNNKK